MKLPMHFLKKLITDPQREASRIKLQRSRITDIFWYSSSYNYRWLRIIINLPIGLVLAFCLYNLGWKRLNFAEFDPVFGNIFKLLIIIGFGVSFAVNPNFRCILLCLCLGGLGKSGQGLMFFFVAEQATLGPLFNVFQNIEQGSHMIICLLETQATLTAQRITLASGPLEEMLEKQIASSAVFGEKIAKLLHNVILPLSEELEKKTDEDETLSAYINSVNVLAQAEDVEFNEEETAEISTTTVETFETTTKKTRFKEFFSVLSERYEKRCHDVFAVAARECNVKLVEIQNQCYSTAPWMLRSLVCSKLSPTALCQPHKFVKAAEEKCVIDEDLVPDKDAVDLRDLKTQIGKQLRINLHLFAVEEPRDEQFRHISEIKTQFQIQIDYFQLIFKTLTEIISTFVLLMIFIILDDVIAMLSKYLNDVNYNNTFLTTYFYYIDKKRKREGKSSLLPFSRAEVCNLKLMTAFSMPTKSELLATWQSLIKWTITLMLATLFVMADFLVYRIYRIVAIFARDGQSEIQGHHMVNIDVAGEGPIAEMIRQLLNFNSSKIVNDKVLTNECTVEPTPPNVETIIWWIYVPLGVMFLLQVIFNFVVKRATLFFVISYVFRKRSKARIIQLYNKLLCDRVTLYRLTKERILLAVQNQEHQTQSIFEITKGNFILTMIIQFFFKTAKCLICEEKFRSQRLVQCPVCSFEYCAHCWKECKSLCYACTIKDEIVNSNSMQIELDKNTAED